MPASTEIINRVEDLIIRCGIKSVTMDDIASELGISKKTLYQYCENKADLIHQVIESHAEEERGVVKEITDRAVHAIEEMIMIARHVIKMFKKISPSVIFDLKKYYRDSYELVLGLRRKFVGDLIRRNILDGIDQGLYRKEINADLISRIYVGTIMAIVDQENSDTQIRMDELYREFIIYHLMGIVNEKGLALLQIHLKSGLE